MDGSILISYKNPEDYNRTIDDARAKLCCAPSSTVPPHFQVTKHRANKTMGLYYIAIFDETGRSAIDLYLTASNFYIVGFRRPELKWVVCANQIGEQKALGGEVLAVASFGSSYPMLLGESMSSSTGLIRLNQCSGHVNALLAYYDASLNSDRSGVEVDAKKALAYFAATIAEALRFKLVQREVADGNFSFSGGIELLQHWMGWSMRPDNKVSRAFAVVPVHETIKSGGEFDNNIIDAMTYFDVQDFVDRFDDGASGSASKLRNFVTLAGEFSLVTGADAEAIRTVKKRMVDFYCRSRIDANVGTRLLSKLKSHKGGNLKNSFAINGFFVGV